MSAGAWVSSSDIANTTIKGGSQASEQTFWFQTYEGGPYYCFNITRLEVIHLHNEVPVTVLLINSDNGLVSIVNLSFNTVRYYKHTLNRVGGLS